VIVPDYERLKQEAMTAINRQTILERYKKSPRCNKIYNKIRAHLQRAGHATMETLLSLDFSLPISPINNEILYILDTKISVAQLELNEIKYYISLCDYRGEEHVVDFAMTHRHQLEPSQLYKLASALDSVVERMFTRLDLLKPNSITSCDKDLLVSFLLTINDNMGVPSSSGTDTDTDTETDTDTDTDIEDTDVEDTDVEE
jgi:hypothetical protein